MFGIAEGYE